MAGEKKSKGKSSSGRDREPGSGVADPAKMGRKSGSKTRKRGSTASGAAGKKTGGLPSGGEARAGRAEDPAREGSSSGARPSEARHLVGNSPQRDDRNPERLQAAINQAIVDEYRGVHAILVDDNMDVQFIQGDINPFLTFKPGRMGLNIMDLARESTGDDLRKLLLNFRRSRKPMDSAILKLPYMDEEILFRIKVRPVRLDQSNASAPLTLLLFEKEPKTEKIPVRMTGSGEAVEPGKDILATNEALENLLRDLGIGVIMLDPNLRVIRFNKPAGLIISLKGGDEGKDLTSLDFHIKIPRLRQDILQVMDSRKELTRRIQGPERVYDMTITPHIGRSKELQGAVLMFHDVTRITDNEKMLEEQNRDLNLIQSELARSEQYFIDLFHRSPACYFVLDTKGLVTDLNATCRNLLGYGEQDLNGQIPADYMVKEDIDTFEHYLKEAQLGREGKSFNICLISKDGQSHRFIAEFYPDLDPEGNLRSIRLGLMDITEMDELKEERAKAEILLDTLFMRSTDGFVIATVKEGRIIRVNQGYLDISGYSEEELLDRTTREIGLLVDAGTREDIVRTLREEGSTAREVKLRRKDGSIIDCLAMIQRVSLGDEELLLGILRDISKRKEMEKSLEEINRELRQRNIDLENFIHTAAHDLRTPLIATIGFFVLLRKKLRGQLEPDTESIIDRISSQLNRYDQLLRDLLDLARVGIKEVQRIWVDTGEEVASILEDMDFPGKDTAQFQIQDGMPRVHMAKSRVRQIFENLLSNSVKFRRTDIPLQLEIGVLDGISTDPGSEPPPGHVVFFVRDNGQGIHHREHEKVFTLFSKSPSGTEDNKGTGVGLAIVKRIIETEGGWIDVESTPGEGATFFFTLPVKEKEA